ncbi:hypothetical protein KZ483_16310 [Paenibacillus sp. sptzw28]|uniref:hypothetical protein n=1 Tax=Paenibacillus sp. sptzw28 TaxID=715179 RepID=UPI001C6F0F36|nr:hypothetical protein [Paenibacillus sp. sptzw28]QYR19481.1 hypothetical protein KZ483_16310 [Paenibacillus sp. sptzw28]
MNRAMIDYRYDEQSLRIIEVDNTEDMEFNIQIVDEGAYLEGIKQVKAFFDDNRVYTDVLFYAYNNNEYRVIVREDYYVDFILAMFKHRLLKSVEWKNA